MDFFDKTLRALDSLGGQNAPFASDGIGVQILCRCRKCNRIWLQDGKATILDLNTEQVQHFARVLRADINHLPLFTCRMCLWRDRGGSISIDEYSQGEAFGFCWEIPHPVVIHAISVIQSRKAAEQLESRPDVLTKKEKLFGVLRFLKEAQPPQNIHLLPPLFGQIQAQKLRPGFGQPGTDHWQWRGWTFALPCPPLERAKDSVVIFTFALPPAEDVSPIDAFCLWRFLLEITFLSGIVEGNA
jgi:hypothetical protein